MAQYIVVDASVAGAWSYNELFTPYAIPVLAAIMGQRVIALAPDRFEEEFLSISGACKSAHHCVKYEQLV